MGDCPSYDHGRQAQIRKQADPFCTGGDPKAFQDLSKKTALFLAEDLAVLPGEPLKNLLLLLDRQYGDPLFFSITAVMKEFPDPLPPAQARIVHQLPRVFKDPRLLQVQGLNDQILLGRKEGIKKCA